MLYVIAVIFLLLWTAGMITGYTMGGFINLFLAISVLVVLLRVIGGQNAHEYLTGGRLKDLRHDMTPNKPVSFVLLGIGIIMMLWGLHGMDALNTDVSQFLIGAETHNVIWMLVAGIAGTSIGLVGVFSSVRKEMKRQ